MTRRIVPMLLLAVVAVVGVLALRGGDDPYIVKAKLDDAGGILKNYTVKVGEVGAGKVTKIDLDRNDDVILTMEMDEGAYPVGRGASAKVRPVNLLGEKYVDLSPGDVNAPVPSGTVIPKNRTALPVELDDALNILDPDTRGAMRILINEAGIAMAGRGADFNKILDELPPALDTARRLVKEVADENVRLASAVTAGDRVVAETNRKRDDLGELVESAGDTLGAVATRRAELGRTVQAAPQALGQLRTTLAGLQGASEQLAPAARDLRATSPALASTLKLLPQFAKDANGTLKEAVEVSPKLTRLGRESTPTLKLLRPTLASLSTFADRFQPFVDTLDGGGGTKSFLEFVAGWTGVTNGADSLGHVFRISVQYDDELLTTALNQYAPAKSGAKKSNKPEKAARGPEVIAPAPRPAAPAEAPKKDLPAKALEDVGKAVDDVLGNLGVKPRTEPSGSESGELLNYLLGS